MWFLQTILWFMYTLTNRKQCINSSFSVQSSAQIKAHLHVMEEAMLHWVPASFMWVRTISLQACLWQNRTTLLFSLWNNFFMITWIYYYKRQIKQTYRRHLSYIDIYVQNIIPMRSWLRYKHTQYVLLDTYIQFKSRWNYSGIAECIVFTAELYTHTVEIKSKFSSLIHRCLS